MLKPLYINDPGVLKTRDQCKEMSFPEWRDYVLDHMDMERQYNEQRKNLLAQISEKIEKIQAINDGEQDWSSNQILKRDIAELENYLDMGERGLFNEKNTPTIIIPDETSSPKKTKKTMISFWVDQEIKDLFAEYANSKRVSVSSALRFFMHQKASEIKASQEGN